MKRKRKLAEVYEDYQKELGSWGKEWGSHFVPGRGRLKEPRAIVIGEAPGQQEDKALAPFVGRSGRFLFEQLNMEAGLDRDDVWTTNVVKYRPPDNRTPTADEIGAARPYLGRELAVVGNHAPPVLLCGSVALSLLELAGGVSKWQGQYMGKYDRTGFVFYITWHPAYVMRRGLDSEAGEQFRKVLAMVGNA